jgi:hypothetical protein
VRVLASTVLHSDEHGSACGVPKFAPLIAPGKLRLRVTRRERRADPVILAAIPAAHAE